MSEERMEKVRDHITKALEALDMNLLHLAIDETINAVGFLHDEIYSINSDSKRTDKDE